ncbi:hypothetical protein PAAG_05320 [Paracoccidioides lutzii Pb01]|uniref:Uncharacterized protein n=1 Tax=Paracoccidioides lutzii (strain ATCC MYA-826 / Pb01) TaxID=502779 RepID=C1H3H7_PARBA|nr:hypothetical protein PAAG_05320 [Paracoccidioides lutzii Pb01]EEH34271.2 hypothetical protein PAAG_05320 [Paracoccidioides lutzii Pb01]
MSWSASHQQAAAPYKHLLQFTTVSQHAAYDESSPISSPISVSDGSRQHTSRDLVTIEEEDSIAFPFSLNNGPLQQPCSSLEDKNTVPDCSLLSSAPPQTTQPPPCRLQQLLDKIQENLEDIVKFYNQWELNRQQAGGTRLDAYKALKRGIRQLMAEEKCGFPGIEAAIPFTYHYFDTLSYNELHEFACLLGKETGILVTLRLASSWVEMGQSIYNGRTKDFTQNQNRLDQELSTHNGLQQKAVSFRTLDHSSQMGPSLKCLLTRENRKPESSSAHSNYSPETSSMEPQNSAVLYASERSLPLDLADIIDPIDFANSLTFAYSPQNSTLLPYPDSASLETGARPSVCYANSNAPYMSFQTTYASKLICDPCKNHHTSDNQPVELLKWG